MSDLQIKAYPVTMHGLSEWTKGMFEHLGWMVLVKDQSSMYTNKQHAINKINSYYESILELAAALQKKITDFSSEPTKVADLEILQKQVAILQAHVAADFKDILTITGGKQNKNKNKNEPMNIGGQYKGVELVDTNNAPLRGGKYNKKM